jgi:hypothetical protein
VDLSGYALTEADKAPQEGWAFPAGLRLPPAGFLVVLCPRSKDALPPFPAAATNVVAARGIKVGGSGVALYDSGGSLAASTGKLPR